MKNVLLPVNVVLILLVAYLYYVNFSREKTVTSKVNTAATTGNDEQVQSQKSRIAYIDLDSLQDHYQYYKKIKAEFEKKQSFANNEIVSLQKKFQSRTTQLQQKANNMTQKEQENAMAEINKMQQDFQTRKQNLDNQLFDYNNKMKEDILDKIETYLKDFNKDGKYSYIFSYEPGFMFYKDSSLNITNTVVEGLNAAYSEKEK